MGNARQTGSTWQQGGLDPACAFQVFGMRRSGNHAIIDWLMRNAPDAATGGLFFNNCATNRDPRSAFASLDVYDGTARIAAHGGGLKDLPTTAGTRPAVVVSYEDLVPSVPKKITRNPSRGFSDSDFGHRILIYRSFLNWSASLLAKLQRNPGWGAVDRVRIMTRAFSTYADGLDRLSDSDVTGICYDEWVTSDSYRAGILDALGLPVRDNSKGEVQRFGGGSSFQGDAKSADDLSSTSRADQMAGNPEYLMILWFAAHDYAFMQRLMGHFHADVEKLADFAETAKVDLKLMNKGAA